MSSTVQLIVIRGWFETVEDSRDEGPEFAGVLVTAGKKLVGSFCEGIMLEVSKKSRQCIEILSLVLVQDAMSMLGMPEVDVRKASILPESIGVV